MPRDISGNYTLPAGNPVVDGTIIDVVWANPTMADFAVQLNNVLTRDGLLGPTSPIKFSSGSAAAPSISFSADPAMGFYRAGSGNLGAAVGGVQVLNLNASGLQLSTLALSGVTDLTTTGNTVLGNAVGDTLNVANGSVQVSAAGNVGVGMVPAVKLDVAGNVKSTGGLTTVVSGVTTNIAADGSGSYLEVLGANAWRLLNNGSTRLSIAAAGAATFTGTVAVQGAIVAVSGGANPYLSLNDGTNTSYLQVSTGELNFVPGNGQASVSGNYRPTSTNTYVLGDSTHRWSSVNAVLGNFSGMITASGGVTGNVTGNVTGDVTGSSGSTTGNAATATALQTARTIAGTSFNGTANITLDIANIGGTVLPAYNGAAVTALNASNLGSGTVPDARFPATLPAASGVNLTALNATQLTSGTVPDARFPATLPAASGANLTALNASNLGSGSVPAARLSGVFAYDISSATVNSYLVGYRGLPASGTTSGALATTDVGKTLYASGGITVPNSTFALGDAVSIINDTAGNITITASITTLYWGAAGTGNRTLASRGMCTIVFKSGTVAYISGSGLS